jgi:cysteinyl-tRNA synthetase
MLAIIQKLIDNGFAYESHAHVLFRVRATPQYGVLSKRNLDEMEAGARVEIAPYKEDPMDFVLWKPAEDGTPWWESPFGKGRPGWHIECSAMSHKYLGEQFDIHAGGQDLMFPHHENELAQNFGAFGCTMARYWLHNNMLVVDGQKMSKSIGNIISLDDILRQYDGEVIRYVLLNSHYQKILNWTDQSLYQAKQGLNRLYGAMRMASIDIDDGGEFRSSFVMGCDAVINALCSNLNTPLALHNLQAIADEIFRISEQGHNQSRVNDLCIVLKNAAILLGLLNKNGDEWFRAGRKRISEDDINRMIEDRMMAKLSKDFERADEIRSKLLDQGVVIEDNREGTTWKII